MMFKKYLLICLSMALMMTSCGNDSDDNASSCGNGTVEDGEQCDDGNDIDNDACSYT